MSAAAHPATHGAAQASFVRKRAVVFGILVAGFVLSFFHRTAPAALAGELTRDFAIGGAVLGTLAATYFYVYTLLQIPVGVLADTQGPRRIVTAGALVAAAGSLAFGLAPTWEIAALGRTLVGIGVAVTFIATLKIIAVWYPAERFATLNGWTMFGGNLGAVLAGAPLAWIVTLLSWRWVFVGLSALSLALALATWLVVRDRPEQAGFAPVHRSAPAGTQAIHWTAALRRVLTNGATWASFAVNAGVAGSYLAFAGLWAVPYLQQVHGMTRNVAALHTSLMLLGVAVGSVTVGIVSDRLRNRRGVMRAYAWLYAASWAPWVLHWPLPLPASCGWFLLMGLLAPGFILNWTTAKEANRAEHAGMATAVVNVGIFLGTGVLQPLVGLVLDRGRRAGDMGHAWDVGILVLAGSAALGALATSWVRETGRR
jgi:sugar phosphate permease